jgi:hypothetical protein
MAVSSGFWPLNLSVESLVLREIVRDLDVSKDLGLFAFLVFA